MREYHDLRLKSDVLLLADIFESLRKTCKQYYKLDPCYYFTSPGLSWDAMLKMTDIKLKSYINVLLKSRIHIPMNAGLFRVRVSLILSMATSFSLTGFTSHKSWF